ncbi:RNA-binding protein [Hyphobacterium marinum]|uniref:RNA-binding protein n=1 Tax=Hyphobacterium marinum TaxID=3116574 RepID=A0ABU7LW84_9PROT|nr:RNA-binding protein [Hyphobacterium sp. Y6023]MEE2565450.1 RNA-binding protein [Hyphobacterium sp. Y6023]
MRLTRTGRTRLADPRANTRERRCAATGETRPEAELIRFAISPDGLVVPDLAAKLPGRGIWVSADRASVARAVKTGGFSRSAKRGVKTPDDLAGQVEALLVTRALSLLGLARRAGTLAAGFDAVKIALKSARPVWRIEASDGARDGREKLDRLAYAAWGDIPVAGCFTAAELGQATGRDALVHAALSGGAQSGAFDAVMGRLSGFRAVDPAREAHENG